MPTEPRPDSSQPSFPIGPGFREICCAKSWYAPPPSGEGDLARTPGVAVHRGAECAAQLRAAGRRVPRPDSRSPCRDTSAWDVSGACDGESPRHRVHPRPSTCRARWHRSPALRAARLARPSERAALPRFSRDPSGLDLCGPPFWRLHSGAVERCPVPFDPALEVVVRDQSREDIRENALLHPRLKAQVACRARAKLPRQGFPLTAGLHSIHDAREDDSIRHYGATAPRLWSLLGQERRDLFPKVVWDICELRFHIDCRSHLISQFKRF